VNKTVILNNPRAVEWACELIRKVDCSQPHDMVLRPHKKGRTLAQNRLLHKWAGETSLRVWEATGELKSPEEWKWYYKHNLLGYDAIEINGVVSKILRSTAKLKVKPFSEFLGRIEAHATVDIGIELTHPQDCYYEAMGIKR
jgi:hypothetical protein